MTEQVKGDTVATGSEESMGAEGSIEYLMSLALDGCLSEEEEARFAQWLAELESESGQAQQAREAQVWTLWQQVDAQLRDEPHMTPSLGFSGGVLYALAIQERRRRLWLGAMVGAAALTLWGTGVLAVVGLALLFMSSEAAWLGEIGAVVTHWGIALWGFADSVTRSIGAVLGTPQARAALMVYCAVAAAMVSLWWIWLRRTTELEAEHT